MMYFFPPPPQDAPPQDIDPRRRFQPPPRARVSWLISPKGRGTSHLNCPRRKRALTRATETFPNEREAKKFARAKLIDTPNLTAGTLNPHLPKRTIASRQIVQWLGQTDGPDAPK
jgi:hypothetical protein